MIPIGQKQRVFGLDVVRAVAILLIMVSHSVLLMAPESDSLWALGARLCGAIVVDVFFVLSGFLIGGLLLRNFENNKIHWKDLRYFWIRRWFRTLPNYYLILLVNVGLGYWVFQNVPSNVWTYFFFLQNATSAMPDFFTESWSLSIEEFSYLIGPFVAYLLLRLRLSKKASFLGAVVVMLVIGWIAKGYFHAQHEVESYHFWTTHLRKVIITRIDSIYYGFLVIYVLQHFPKFVHMYKRICFILGKALLIGMHGLLFWLDATVVNAPSFFNLWYLPLISVSVGLMLFEVSSWRKAPLRLQRPVRFVSIVSYALYLVNFSIVFMLLQEFFPVTNMTTSIVRLLSFWILSFTLAAILYRFYEQPMTDLRDHKKLKQFLGN